MGKSDLLKNDMKSGLDGLLSSTGKAPQKKEPAPVKAEKEPAVHCNFVINKSIHTRMRLLSIEKEMSLGDRERGDDRVSGEKRKVTGCPATFQLLYMSAALPPHVAAIYGDFP